MLCPPISLRPIAALSTSTMALAASRSMLGRVSSLPARQAVSSALVRYALQIGCSRWCGRDVAPVHRVRETRRPLSTSRPLRSHENPLVFLLLSRAYTP